MNYAIFTDATADVPREHLNDIEIIPMTLNVDGEQIVYDGRWDDERIKQFYQRLRGGAVAATSQIAPHVYETRFEDALRAGTDVLYLCFSSGMSGTIQSAVLTARELMDKYPGRTIEIVDSMSATCSQGMQAAALCENRARGMTLHENAAWMRAHAGNFASWFTVEDLMYLYRGGRVSRMAAVFGTALHLMPILHINDEGRLSVSEKAQGRKVSLRALARKVGATALADENPTVYIGHCDCEADALLTEKLIKAALPMAQTRVAYFSPVIGAHTGPGTVAVMFYASER